MTARWHLGPVTRLPLLGRARHVARSARLPLLHDHRSEDGARRADAHASSTRSSLGLLAALLIAPTTTEFAAKVALLGALAVVCIAMPVLRRLPRRTAALDAVPVVAAAYVVLLVTLTTTAPCRRRRGECARPAADRGRPVTRSAVEARHRDRTRDRDGVRSRRARGGRALRIWLKPGTDQGPPLASRWTRGRRTSSTSPGSRPGRSEATRPRAGRRHRPGRRLAAFACRTSRRRSVSTSGRARSASGCRRTTEGDDGRRRLLDRLQRRRLARPLRRQLVRERRHDAVGRARRAAADGALRERARSVPERQPRHARQSRGAGRRLRRGRPRRRRQHRSRRHDRDRRRGALEHRAAGPSSERCPRRGGTRAPPSPT